MGIYPPQVPEDTVVSASGLISALKCACVGRGVGLYGCECGHEGMDPSTAPPLSRFYREVSQAAAGKRACEPV